MTGENGFRPRIGERVYDGQRTGHVNGVISGIDYEFHTIDVQYDDGWEEYEWTDFYNTWNHSLGGYWAIS